MPKTFWSNGDHSGRPTQADRPGATIPTNYSGERELKVQLSRPLQLKLVSVERSINGEVTGREEHCLYVASKFHRGGIQLCRFMSDTTQQVDITFEAGDILHFKALGDTQAPMYLIGNLLEKDSRESRRSNIEADDRNPAILPDPIVIDI